MTSQIGSKTEKYKLFRTAFQHSTDEGNIQFASRAIYQMLDLYDEQFPQLIPLKTRTAEFVTELIKKGNFKRKDLTPDEYTYYVGKFKSIVIDFQDVDMELALGEEDDAPRDVEFPDSDVKPDESKLS